MILAKFRHKYPQGSLVSQLIEIDRGTYIVKALVQIDNLVLATALAGAATVEEAEDAAKERAVATLFLDHQANTSLATQSDRQVKPQPATSESISLETNSKPTNNHKIVNFSKPQSELASQNQDSILETIIPETLTADSIPQLDLSPESVVKPPSPAETNLFNSDTFVAETLPATSPTENNEDSIDLSATNLVSPELEAMDFNEIKQKTDIEIKRLSWTKDQGKEFLMSRYGKRSRLHLTDEQLLEFLRYLEKLPNPVK